MTKTKWDLLFEAISSTVLWVNLLILQAWSHFLFLGFTTPICRVYLPNDLDKV
jgi:hypothetical protein